MKKLFGIAATALLSLGFFSASAEAATVVTADVLNVRQGPTTGSTVVGKVTEGQTLQVTNRLNGWLQIQYNGQVAYVSTAYTKETGEAPIVQAPNATNLYYINTSGVVVRSGPGENYKVLGTLTKGRTIKPAGATKNGFTPFIYKGQTGYVSSQYVSKAATYVGQELYVESTAYTPGESRTGLTTLGYNVRQPGLKMIAVDPRIIPLGSRVWVEGYGEAIAGDTGGAIQGYKIDVLLPTTKQALEWGRKRVKIRILS